METLVLKAISEHGGITLAGLEAELELERAVSQAAIKVLADRRNIARVNRYYYSIKNQTRNFMPDPIVVCNKENGCYSTPFGRNCWVVNDLLGLVMAEADRLYEQASSDNGAEMLKRIMEYCQHLRAENKEHWYDTILTAEDNI